MPITNPCKPLTPEQVLRPKDTDPSPGDFTLKFLTQGDSWFSIGALPPWATTNLLMQLALPQTSCAVNCAHPGDTLAHLVDWRRDPQFLILLAGRQTWRWDGILLSAGGNDLIDAAGVLPVDSNGKPRERWERLLLGASEWGTAPDASRYVSPEGWTLFEHHLRLQFDELIATRDSPRSPNKDVPIIVHGYDYALPRNAPASHFPSLGPWLYPAVVAYAIPKHDWRSLGTELIARLDGVLASLNLPHVHFAATAGTITPAQDEAEGSSGDWENEIHPTKAGYTKLASKLAATIGGLVGS